MQTGQDAARDLAADVANIVLEEMKREDGPYMHYLQMGDRSLMAFQHLGKMMFAVDLGNKSQRNQVVFSDPGHAYNFFTSCHNRNPQDFANLVLKNEWEDISMPWVWANSKMMENGRALDAYIDICLHEHVPVPKRKPLKQQVFRVTRVQPH